MWGTLIGDYVCLTYCELKNLEWSRGDKAISTSARRQYGR